MCCAHTSTHKCVHIHKHVPKHTTHTNLASTIFPQNELEIGTKIMTGMISERRIFSEVIWSQIPEATVQNRFSLAVFETMSLYVTRG